MPLDSNSTMAEAKAAYLDNADYEEVGSVAKARTFVTACRHLLLHLPKASGHGSVNFTLTPEILERSLDKATAFVRENAAAGSGAVIHSDFSGFRD